MITLGHQPGTGAESWYAVAQLSHNLADVEAKLW